MIEFRMALTVRIRWRSRSNLVDILFTEQHVYYITNELDPYVLHKSSPQNNETRDRMPMLRRQLPNKMAPSTPSDK